MSFTDTLLGAGSDWIGDEIIKAPGDYVSDRIKKETDDFVEPFANLQDALAPIEEEERAQISAGHITDNQIKDALEDKDSGVANLTALLRGEEYNDWKERYWQRTQDFAEKMASDETIVEAVDQAKTSTSQGFENANTAMAMNNERYGIQLNPEDKAQQEKSMGMSEVAQMVNNTNDARVGAKDRQNQFVSGGMGMSLDTSAGKE
jgi:hypothetical protein